MNTYYYWVTVMVAAVKINDTVAFRKAELMLIKLKNKKGVAYGKGK